MDARTRLLATRDPLSAAAAKWTIRENIVWVPCTMPSEHLKAHRNLCDCGGTGKLVLTMRQRLEIGAYCGHPGCQVEVGNVCPICKGSGGDVVECSHCDGSGSASRMRFSDWLYGLKWPQALLRAAVAAAWCAGKTWWCLPDCGSPGRGSGYAYPKCIAEHIPTRCAIDAAKAWLADPTSKNREAWWAAYKLIDSTDACLWVPSPYHVEQYVPDIQAAAGLAGGKPVRKKIQKELIEWVL